MTAPHQRHAAQSRDGDPSHEREAIPLDLAPAPLWDELREHLEQEGPSDWEKMREEWQHLSWGGTAAGEALRGALAERDPSAVLELAQRLGREWLAAG
jgi:hypothetical protein